MQILTITRYVFYFVNVCFWTVVRTPQKNHHSMACTISAKLISTLIRPNFNLFYGTITEVLASGHKILHATRLVPEDVMEIEKEHSNENRLILC
jgi:hypothetical protein